MISANRTPRVLLAKAGRAYHAWPIANDFCPHQYRIFSSAYPALAGALHGDGVAFYDGLFEPGASPRRLGELAQQFPVVALGSVSPMAALDTEAHVAAIRQLAPQTKIVLGGHHATFYADEWIQRGAHAVVRGEGEVTFPELIARWQAGESAAGIAGLTWNDDGRAVIEPDRPLVKKLDDLPPPDFGVVNLPLYNLGIGPHGLSGCVETSRGCAHRCSFCVSSAMWQRRQRFKSLERVQAEIESLYARGVRQLMFADENFGISRTRDLALFDWLRRRDMTLWAFVRADTVFHDPEWTAAAIAAGLKMALVGFESLDPHLLAVYRKENDGALGLPEYREVYRRLKAGGAFVYGLFVRDYDFSGYDDWSPRLLGQVCDLSAQGRFIPMRGASGLEELRAKGYQFHDRFYHNRFIPSFTYEGRKQPRRFLSAIVTDLLNPRRLFKALAGSYVERTFLRRVYGGIVRDMLTITPLGLKAAWLALRRSRSPEQRLRDAVDVVLRQPL